MSETAIEEVVGLSRRAGKSADRLTRQLETHREFALDALRGAKHELDRLLSEMENDEIWIGASRTWTGHAGYSNGIQGYVATAYVHLGAVNGIVEGVIY